MRRKATGITTAEAAAIIKSSPQFVRAGMQQGLLQIGCAIKMPNSPTWTYNISPKLLAEYAGVDIDQELNKLRNNS